MQMGQTGSMQFCPATHFMGMKVISDLEEKKNPMWKAHGTGFDFLNLRNQLWKD
jgi:hypothetical protein